MAARYDIDNPVTWGTFCRTDQRPMGLGVLNLPTLIFKRKFRWTMAIQYCLGSGNAANIKLVNEEFVKMASRPQLTVGESIIDYLHGKLYLPGKVEPQTMEVTWYDVAGVLNAADLANDPRTACLTEWYETDGPGGTCSNAEFPQLTTVFGWIASVYDITDPCNLYMGSRQGDYSGEALLRLYDGCGATVEAWLISNIFPTNINFGELDMSSSDEVTIAMTLRWSTLQYRSLCPATTISKCQCTPCDA